MIVSFEKITNSIRVVAYRFPFAMLAALIGVTIGLLFVHDKTSDFSVRLLLTAVLAFPLFVSTELLAESFALPRVKKYALNASGALFLLLYYLWLPDDLDDLALSVAIRSVLWFIGLWLSILFASHLRRAPECSNGIWRHIQVLAYAVVMTGLWAAAIGLGLSAALGSVNFLFNAGISEYRYAELAVLVAGLFSTTSFLSRVPRGPGQDVGPENYPTEARLLSQYVLVPLVSLYFLILYAYVIRVLLLWEWPKGMLAYMILGFSSLGILVYGILSPLRGRIAWVRRAGNGFFIVLIPQIGMLFWALWFRISEYGITENRYYVGILGLWLLAMALYFLWSARRDVRMIPISLCLIAFLTSFGPWGALSVSERSQINRLEQLLDRNDLLVDGVAAKAQAPIPEYDGREISGIVLYLSDVHGMNSMQRLFSVDIAMPGVGKWEKPKALVEDHIGIDYKPAVYASDDSGSTYFSYGAFGGGAGPVIKTSGYLYVVEIGQPERTVMADGAEYQFRVRAEDSVLEVVKANVPLAQVDMAPLLSALSKEPQKNGVAPEMMVLAYENEHIVLEAHFTSIHGRVSRDGGYTTDFSDGILLFSLKGGASPGGR